MNSSSNNSSSIGHRAWPGRAHAMRPSLLLVFAAVLAVVGMAPAHAITQGQPDGELHPNVGAVVADYGPSPGPEIACSGTLIAPTVFLLPAHCAEFVNSLGRDVWVTFDSTYDEQEASPAGLIAGTAVGDPLFGSGAKSDPHDIAVFLLEQSPGITPATLPTAGFLDAQAAAHTLQTQMFTPVGYGWTRVDKTEGPGNLVFRDGVRRYSQQSFSALEPSWLKLSSNAALDNGGTCFNDSGAPHFYGGVTSSLTVSMSIAVDPVCRSLDKTYRLDTKSARDFLGQFVSLP